VTPAPLRLRLQDLAPRWAHFCLGIERFVREELHLDFAHTTLLVALSGGSDSTALFRIIHFLAPRLDCRLAAAHLNHGLRPESSAEAAAVADLCRCFDVECRVDAADVGAMAATRRCGLEEAGRVARYEFFVRAAEDLGAQFILTAHTLNDLAEDVLMRLTRGAGWPGLSGMEAVTLARRLVRPLLFTPKQTLVDFLTDLDQPWSEDSSNALPGCLRNRVRHELLPLFLRENPSFLESVADLWRLGRIDAAYWDMQIAGTSAPFLPNVTLVAADKALRLRLFKACLDALGPGQAQTPALLQLDRAWERRDFGATLQFPGDKRGRVTVDGVEFFRAERSLRL